MQSTHSKKPNKAMGTSQSSSGSPSGVPLVPPWVPDIPDTIPLPKDDTDGAQDADDANDGDDGDDTAPNAAPDNSASPLAPKGRFRAARTSLGKYAGSGDKEDLRKTLGHYVHKGYGGSRTALRRLGGTVSNAGSLYGALSDIASRSDKLRGTRIDPAVLAGKPAGEIVDAIIETVCATDGTQDAEAARASMKEALSDLLTRFPDADIMSLTEEEIAFVIEQYVGNDVFHRFDLDLGKVVQEKAQTAAVGLSRLKEIKDYVKETVAASFRKLKDAAHTFVAGRIPEVVATALLETFNVFESYLQ